MIPTIRRALGHLALAVTLVGGAGLVPSTSTAGIETSLPPGQAAPPVTQEEIVLAQAVAALTRASYSREQSDRGEKSYKRECEECHGKDLRGGLNGGAPLRGLAFEGKYFDGLPASVLFGFMSSAMPPNSPGRYSPDAYADLMAYILKWNGIQPGAPLPSDLDALSELTLDK